MPPAPISLDETRELRIAFVMPSLGKGGAEKQVALLSTRLKERGYEVAVFALFEGGDWERYLREHEVPAAVLDCMLYNRVDKEALKSLWKLASVLRAYNPHIVNGFLYPYSIWTALASRLARVPVVTDNRRDFFSRDQAPLPHWLERISAAGVTRFVANCHAIADDLRWQQGLPPGRISVIHNGVDIPQQIPRPSLSFRQRLAIPDAAVVVGMLANLWPYKNHLMLVRAAEQVIARQPDVVFVLAGRDQGTQQAVEREIARLGIESHFRIVGEIQDTSPLLSIVDIGVLCSTTEGFSNTLLEYMAHGKPVVATRVGGSSEIVLEGETGYLVESDDVSGLAGAILQLGEDPARRAAMGQRGRVRVQEAFNWDVAFRQWEDLFALLAGRGG